MKNWLTPTFLLFLVSFALFFSCKKINEATTVGDDVIPGVDGVTTFDTTLEVETYNELFTAINDSFSTNNSLTRNSNHIFGNIQNDPLFGKINAKLFFELKPSFYKYYFANKPDSLTLDSVVLVLGWKSTFGDTNSLQRVRVYEIDQSSDFRQDTLYQLREQYVTYSNLLGTKDFYPYQLDDSVKTFKDSANNQLRIRLNDSFGNRLLAYDSTTQYASDSAFRTYFKGFALEADPAMGNALMSFALASEPSTKLAIYYKFQNKGKVDTTVNYFTFTDYSANHNYVSRDIAGTPFASSIGGTSPDPLVYLANVPGSYVRVKIPGLKTLSNRIINRAELLMEQVYDPSDAVFARPEALYLDIFDSSISKYKCIPYDFVADQTGVAYIPFGMFGKDNVDLVGNPIRKWSFNITRYVQNVLTGKTPAVDDFRLLTHNFVIDQIRLSNSTNTGDFSPYVVDINTIVGTGRVRLGGGNHPTQKMKLRIVYTKI